MAITKDALLVTSRELLVALKDLLGQTNLPDKAPVCKQAQAAIDNAEDLIGEEVRD
jgi:hypothetical protein